MVLAAFVISLIALGVAILTLPTVFHMFWGRPKISLESGTGSLEDALVLECKIWNDPIDNKLLKTMRVNRMPADDLTAYIEIKEAGSNKVIVPKYTPKIRSLSGVYAQRISLAASPLPVSFPIVYKSGTDPVRLAKEGSSQTFDVGKYVASISVIADYKALKEKWAFVISGQEPYLYWS